MKNNVGIFVDDLIHEGLGKNYWFMTKQTLSDFYLPLFVAKIVDTFHSNHKKSENFAKYYQRCFVENKYANIRYPKQAESENCYRNAIIGEFLGLFTRTNSKYDSGEVTGAYKVLSKYITTPEDINTYQYLVDRQIEKIFLNNPISNNYSDLKQVKLFPIIYMYKILLEIDKIYGDSTITTDEFKLFIVHSKEYSDWGKMVSLISEYRKMYKISDDLKTKIDSIVNDTTMKNIRFDELIALLQHININKDTISISSDNQSKQYIQTVVDLYEHSDVYINKFSVKECIEFMKSDNYFIGKMESIPMIKVSNLEKNFKKWLDLANKNDQGEVYTSESKEKYFKNLKNINTEFGLDVFSISNLSSINDNINKLLINKDFIDKNNNCKYSYSCALKIYQRFLSETFYNKQENKVIDESERIKGGFNTILYGVPGAGKSWTIKKEYCDDESKIERLVFHPDYTYSDFIGQILPRVNDIGNVSYEFVPGPFTKLLKKAYFDCDNMYYLIIEEVNRGNAPAIFGDVFQLLDRDDNGTSEYGITNEDIAKAVYGDSTKKVSIPSNMTIICTMNTSDQNVFTLDTAFQRRWNMRLIRNEFNINEQEEMKFSKTLILDTSVTWEKFFNEINKIILEKNIKMTSSEDKRLGTHFVNELDLMYDDEVDDNGNMTLKATMQNRRFPEKVLKYLWDDAFKFTKEDIFDTDKYKSLESIINSFLSLKGNDRFTVFKDNIYNSLLSTNK